MRRTEQSCTGCNGLLGRILAETGPALASQNANGADIAADPTLTSAWSSFRVPPGGGSLPEALGARCLSACFAARVLSPALAPASGSIAGRSCFPRPKPASANLGLHRFPRSRSFPCWPFLPVPFRRGVRFPFIPAGLSRPCQRTSASWSSGRLASSLSLLQATLASRGDSRCHIGCSGNSQVFQSFRMRN
jgi:hypothetical protein